MCWVGIDVSKACLDVCILETTGELQQMRVANDDVGFKQLVKRVAQGNTHIVVEATGVYHLQLQQALQEDGFTLSVINPRQIVGFAKSYNRRNKTDKVDASLLAHFARERQPPASPKLSTTRAKSILRELQALNDDLTRLNNRLAAASAGLAHSAVKDSLKRRIDQLQSEKESLEQQLEQALAEQAADIELLTTIPGIGRRTACSLLAEIGDVRRFDAAGQLVAWAGLTPQHRQSGQFKGYTAISRMGSSILRRLLYMPTLAALRFNPRIATFYTRLVNNAKPKMVALVAAMAKLLRIVFGVLTASKPFDATLPS